jgi:hypothetical protein
MKKPSLTEKFQDSFFGKAFQANTLEMAVMKKAVNYFIWHLSRNTPDEAPEWPVTQLLDKVYQRLESALMQEKNGLLKPKKMHLNFQRLLPTTFKFLTYVGNHDPYYRQWLGYLMLTIFEEMEKAMLTFKVEDIDMFKKIENLEQIKMMPGSRKLLFYWWLTGHLAFMDEGPAEVQGIVTVELDKKTGE